MRPTRLRLLARIAAVTLAGALAACATQGGPDLFTPSPKPTAHFANLDYAAWTEDEAQYRLYPGDEIDVQIPSAPELGKTAVVQPDGRVAMPLIGPIMVADRSIEQVEAAMSQAYSADLLRPQVEVAIKTTQPLKVFVGGEVDKPGVYDMPGDIDAFRAVIMAGGFKTSAKRGEVVVIRRAANGKAMMRTVNLIRGITDPGRTDLVPLRRFDIVYVPRTHISEAGLFVQQYFRDITPVQLGFSYALGAKNGLTGF